MQILEAAAETYPDNLDIRFALAGAYARIGRSQDALALYKSIPMNQAGSGDFQGAIWSAISAKDMAQAEIWLRAALDRFPSDPNVLSLAARFEQARGNKQRATEFWRAAIAAAPPGSAANSFENGAANSFGSSPASNRGDIKRLLNPSLDPSLNEPSPDQLAPLPSYKSLSSPQATLPPLPSATDTTTAFATAPSNNPLPLPFAARDEAAEQGTAPSTPPVFVSPRTASNTNSSAVEPSPFNGSVHLSPLEQNVNSTTRTDAEVQTGITASYQPWINEPEPSPASPQDNLRISPEPMNLLAAQAQARFAAQTDSQPPQGSAALIHAIPNAVSPAASPNAAPAQASAPTTPLTAPAAASAPSNATPAQANAPAPATPPAATRNSTSHSDHGVSTIAQNTPSAQDAASGAYSAPQQQQPPTPPPASATCQTDRARLPTRQTHTQSRPSTSPTASHKHPRKPALNPRPKPGSPRKLSATRPSALHPKTRHPPPRPPNPKRNPNPRNHLRPASRRRTSAAKSSAASRPLDSHSAPGRSAQPARSCRAATPGHRERLQRLARRHFAAQLSQRRSRLLAARRHRVAL